MSFHLKQIHLTINENQLKTGGWLVTLTVIEKNVDYDRFLS